MLRIGRQRQAGPGGRFYSSARRRRKYEEASSATAAVASRLRWHVARSSAVCAPSASTTAPGESVSFAPLNLFRCDSVHQFVDDPETGETHEKPCNEYAT